MNRPRIQKPGRLVYTTADSSTLDEWKQLDLKINQKRLEIQRLDKRADVPTKSGKQYYMCFGKKSYIKDAEHLEIVKSLNYTIYEQQKCSSNPIDIGLSIGNQVICVTFKYTTIKTFIIMKMCAKLPLDGKNFKYVICNDGVRITGKLPITRELASLSICDLKLDGSLDGYYKVVILEIAGKYYLSTEVHYSWREFNGFRDSFMYILELLKDARRNLVDKHACTLATDYLNRLKNPIPKR